ncbi:meiotically up-regulated 65 protein [Nannizzia gypsea CBS 118893]|uniref:Meiotically up-regulated 65 protein n=1 Tax=Arthroderma gypseum (strain ATCC MYA-4604 / CBS 118893) TaxID=535722 RepID=E5R0R5_ARTGP|nr:meiotically up-regulated 65 protein [Nannizzia gypsea CBS 118893]EFQ97571.1 meiotically up-regulated 65 protein [Nannizzia gypsea CBS 118893]
MASGGGILLVDNTRPAHEPDEPENGLQASRTSTRRSLAKKLTGLSVRENLARRKYAKYQQGRYNGVKGVNGTNGVHGANGINGVNGDDSRLSREITATSPREGSLSRSTSIAGSSCAIRRSESDVAFDAESYLQEQPTAEELQPQSQSEIDVLYENQRGWFFFGKPIFSQNSLLNLDPPAWMTATFEKSPVTIANAQVPDPSWEWDWKTWYVDMSYDVDEEGWQYSFSFASKFSWHGTHPWCFSFVRRRRWLRRRVRRSKHRPEKGIVGYGLPGSCEHSILTAGEAGTTYTGQLSRISQDEWEETVAPEDITNVAILSKAMRISTLDRERIDAVREFVHRGGDGLVLLEDKMPELLSMLLFHSSRRELVKLLKQSMDEIPQDSSDESARARRENLHKAYKAGDRLLRESLGWNGA